jgi:hypothetical protein
MENPVPILNVKGLPDVAAMRPVNNAILHLMLEIAFTQQELVKSLVI